MRGSSRRVTAALLAAAMSVAAGPAATMPVQSIQNIGQAVVSQRNFLRAIQAGRTVRTARGWQRGSSAIWAGLPKARKHGKARWDYRR